MEDIKKELSVLAKTFMPCAVCLVAVSLFTFAFGLRQATFGIYYPFPSTDSVAASVLKALVDRLVPGAVRVVALSPLDVFVSLVLVAFIIGVVATYPYFCHKLIAYLGPALYTGERKLLVRLSMAMTGLFIAGVLFAYYVVIPQTLRFLYIFAAAVGIGELFHIVQFVGFVLGLAVVIGVMFQLPIVMFLLSKFDVVDSSFWRRRWRHALVAALVMTAVVTPDGSGISMMLLSLPVVGLYWAGIIVVDRITRVKVKEGTCLA